MEKTKDLKGIRLYEKYSCLLWFMIELLLNGFSRERLYLSENIISQDGKLGGGGEGAFYLLFHLLKNRKKDSFSISKFVS